jgi:hypothetical protein
MLVSLGLGISWLHQPSHVGVESSLGFGGWLHYIGVFGWVVEFVVLFLFHDGPARLVRDNEEKDEYPLGRQYPRSLCLLPSEVWLINHEQCLPASNRATIQKVAGTLTHKRNIYVTIQERWRREGREENTAQEIGYNVVDSQLSEPHSHLLSLERFAGYDTAGLWQYCPFLPNHPRLLDAASLNLPGDAAVLHGLLDDHTGRAGDTRELPAKSQQWQWVKRYRSNQLTASQSVENA